jgi:hypothetical protein
MTLRAELSSDSYAKAEGVAVHTGSPIIALCRSLLAAGHTSSLPMEVYRGEVLALHVRSIGEATGLRVNSAGTGFIRDQQWPPIAPPVRLTELSSLAA